MNKVDEKLTKCLENVEKQNYSTAEPSTKKALKSSTCVRIGTKYTQF